MKQRPTWPTLWVLDRHKKDRYGEGPLLSRHTNHFTKWNRLFPKWNCARAAAAAAMLAR